MWLDAGTLYIHDSYDSLSGRSFKHYTTRQTLTDHGPHRHAPSALSRTTVRYCTLSFPNEALVPRLLSAQGAACCLAFESLLVDPHVLWCVFTPNSRRAPR